MSTDIKDTFLQLVRVGIGTSKDARITNEVDWVAVKALAERQGLTGVLADGLEQVPQELKPPKPVTLQLIGEVLNGFEYRYELYRRAIAEMAAFYNCHDFKMMVLKGYACSLDWPKPEHRPSGDIDIWQFGKQKEADVLLKTEKKIEIDSSHHHHTVFYWRDFMVENHYDFINVHHHKSHAEFERILKELGSDDSYYTELYGERVYLPSPNLHALFLIKHLMLHFSTGEINMRQLLDWGFFVEKHGEDVDWEWLESTLEHFGMMDLYNVFNAICVGDLGFDLHYFNQVQFDPRLKERVLNDILSPEFGDEMPKSMFKRVIWKWRRWKANEWKHKLCYKESMWSAFWSGVWNHLLKPSSI